MRRRHPPPRPSSLPADVPECIRGRQRRGTDAAFFTPPQHFAADAFGGFLGVDFPDGENSLGVVAAETFAEAIAALRNQADPAPFAVANLEDLPHNLDRHPIAVGLNDAGILVLHHGAARFQLAHGHQRAFHDVDRFEAGDDDRDAKAGADRLIFAVAHDGAHVSRPEKSLHPIEGRLQDRGQGRRHEDVRNQDGKIADLLPARLPDGHGIGRRGGLKSNGEKDDLFVRIGAGDFEAIDGRIDKPGRRRRGISGSGGRPSSRERAACRQRNKR